MMEIMFVIAKLWKANDAFKFSASFDLKLNKNLKLFSFYLHSSDVGKRVGMDIGSYKCWTLLRHLPPPEVQTMANTQARL